MVIHWSYRNSKPINVTRYKSWEARRHLGDSKMNTGQGVEGSEVWTSSAPFWASDFTSQGLGLLTVKWGS